MSGAAWFDKHFSTCDHGLVRGYCPTCSAADREEKTLKELKAENRELRTENERLRKMLAATGVVPPRG